MPALCRLLREIFLIEVQDQLLCLKAKLLVKQHGWVVGRDMQCYVFAHAGLEQVQLCI